MPMLMQTRYRPSEGGRLLADSHTRDAKGVAVENQVAAEEEVLEAEDEVVQVDEDDVDVEYCVT